LFAAGFYAFGILVKTYNIQTDFPYGEDPYLLTMMYVVFGGGGISGMVGFFLIPFFPLLALNTGIYLLIRSLFKKGKFDTAKKVVKFFAISTIIASVAMYTHAFIDFYVHERELSHQNKYYWEKYGTEEEVELPYKLIGIGNDAIYICLLMEKEKL